MASQAVFKYLLNTYESLATAHKSVDYEAINAPEDHLAINVCAGCNKLADYYSKLDDSPYYFIATLLHPYYKTYCDNAWREKDGWFAAGYAGFQRVWRKYKPLQPLCCCCPTGVDGSIDNTIDAFVNSEMCDDAAEDDEYNGWIKYETHWTIPNYRNWQLTCPQYPPPAATVSVGPELLAALLTLRSWICAGFKTPSGAEADAYSDKEVDAEYAVEEWKDANI
ncbi:hypothetical protein BU25DRAFT_426043 [Macroventuria anomochaeta]|uniref:Uncharacterized protein n=1 Tax=Macroventuria anomochaeta TaxID=301207 RepID=A0ACB6RIV5_9PLEO|nr:uncharacterized protein BU25DRAFT_426043 [Macroventuria anomochaeta]KAF2621921.1 hypothetical protein BU25DRAFT_426043 [Macroventuria anomochaeta]